ncbi:hypothetical protein MRB53_034424 [Persea americana]|uniref:Uncharacterized protein n=1 Tax=Persea americana TaxID=3435 RepID=A0ACC2K1Z7_PERAE|nr:hypothetical protein MRB53_034424 [Persea americana]
MADGTRSHDLKKLEDSFRILKEQEVNSAKETTEIKNTLVEIKEFMAAVTFKYDQVAAHVYGKQRESVPGGPENQIGGSNQFGAESTQSQHFPGFGTRELPKELEEKKAKVFVADGTKMTSNAACKGFKREMQGVVFQTDMRVMELKGCDMVLGIQWFATLGPVKWDLKNLSIDFTLNNRRHVLRGGKQGESKSVDAEHMKNLL